MQLYNNLRITNPYVSQDVFNLQRQNYPSSISLNYGTVNFTSLKKNNFEGIDYACVEKFKPPIEKFNSNSDLQDWAGRKFVETYADKKFGGRQGQTMIQRNAMVNEWVDYLSVEKSEYSPAASLLIMDAVTKHLKDNNDNLPPVLNKRVLSSTMSQIVDNLKNDKSNHPVYDFDLSKIYQNNIRAFYLEDISTDKTGEKWVVIPSKNSDRENFDTNVDKLKMLSYKTWCTKSYNAEKCLGEGDLDIYLEDEKPKIAVRFIDDKIQEIQGEKNDGSIPVKYFDTVNKYVAGNGFSTNLFVANELKKTAQLHNEISKVRGDLKDEIKNNDAEKIFNYFGISTKKQDDGTLSISEYYQPTDKYTYEDIGIDENKLLGNVSRIERSADFYKSSLKKLGNIKSIGENAYFFGSKIKTLDNLEEIGKDADFSNSKVIDLGKLKKIGASAIFKDSEIESLKNIETIGENATFMNSKVKDLGLLKRVGKKVILGKYENIAENDFDGVAIRDVIARI